MPKKLKALTLVILLLAACLTTSLLFLQTSFAANSNTNNTNSTNSGAIKTPDIKFELSQPFGPLEREITITGTTLAEYILAAYSFGFAVIVILAIIVIMIAGLQWIAAAGDGGAINTAKSAILRAFIALGIVIISNLLLSTVGIVDFSSLSVEEIEGIPVPALTNQYNLAGVGGKNAKEVCENIMKRTAMIEAYKKMASQTGISWTLFAGIHYRERNNSTKENPWQFDYTVNKYGKQARCRVWPGACDCVVEFVSKFGTTDEFKVAKTYNCGSRCNKPYFYTHNDPENGVQYNIKGRIDGGAYINKPDSRPGALIISNALKAGCP